MIETKKIIFKLVRSRQSHETKFSVVKVHCKKRNSIPDATKVKLLKKIQSKYSLHFN